MNPKLLTWIALLLIVLVAPVLACNEYIVLTVVIFCAGLIIIVYQMATGQLKLFG